jgi:starch synthase (maltosyl-transferring)
MREYFRPNFWPNTPDILPVVLQNGGRPAFIIRAALAATLSSNYGIYGPAFELCYGRGIEGSEEYLDSEKYEIKEWYINNDSSIAEIIAMINKIRREYTAFQTTWNVEFVETENEALLAYLKYGKEGDPHFLVAINLAINLDTHHKHSGMVHLPLWKLGIESNTDFIAHDLITNDRFVWEGGRNYIELSPHHVPLHIIQLHPTIKEKQFDQFV